MEFMDFGKAPTFPISNWNFQIFLFAWESQWAFRKDIKWDIFTLPLNIMTFFFGFSFSNFPNSHEGSYHPLPYQLNLPKTAY
jgi:hypothetical protein